MRKVFSLVPVLILLLGMLGRPASAALTCPGTGACVYDPTCPKGGVVVGTMKALQAAIKQAPCTGGTICVKPGVYVGKIDFQGKPITIKSTGGAGATFLDGAGSGPVVRFHTFEGADSILEGFTIRNGVAPSGGGIQIDKASPIIRYNVILNNKATDSSGFGRGGGMLVIGASAKPVVTCNRFIRNEANYDGGGLISVYSADPYVRFAHFEGNKAPYGAGIGVARDGRLDLAMTVLQSNVAGGDGGGIHAGVPYGNAQVRNVCLKGNTASGNGGGIWVPFGLVQVLNSTFSGNKASAGGGLAAGYGSSVDVVNSLFVGNSTSGGGSAALVNTDTSTTSVVNHFNGFFGNTGGDYLSTYGDVGLLSLDPALSQCGGCCPGTPSPANDAGNPIYFFNDASDGTRNDMGACGGPQVW
jgi:hypothetical protein